MASTTDTSARRILHEASRMQLRSIDTLAPAHHSARILDALLMMLFIVRQPVPFLPVAFPVSDVAALALLGVAFFRRPTRLLSPVSWWFFITFAMLGGGVMASIMNDDDDFIRRTGSIGILILLSIAIASGRIDAWSGLKGLIFGFVLNAALFYIGVAPDAYAGVLTGYLQDKNVVGLYCAVVPFAALAFLSKFWQRSLVLLGGIAGAWLADSRTSMAALAIAIAFLIAGKLLGTVFRLGLAGLLTWIFFWTEANFSHIGEYVNRLGSDALRGRIDTAMIIKADTTPWYGRGLGEANVVIEAKQWLFHNSFYGLFVEGGWIMLVAGLAVFITVALLPFPASPNGPSSTESDVRLAIQAGVLALMLCATRLGETFLTLPAFLLVGVGLALICDRFDAYKTETISKKAISAKSALKKELDHRRILEERAERAHMEEHARTHASGPVFATQSTRTRNTQQASDVPSSGTAPAKPPFVQAAAPTTQAAPAIPAQQPTPPSTNSQPSAPGARSTAPAAAPLTLSHENDASASETPADPASASPAAPGSRRARRLAEQTSPEGFEAGDDGATS